MFNPVLDHGDSIGREGVGGSPVQHSALPELLSLVLVSLNFLNGLHSQTPKVALCHSQSPDGGYKWDTLCQPSSRVWEPLAKTPVLGQMIQRLGFPWCRVGGRHPAAGLWPGGNPEEAVALL